MNKLTQITALVLLTGTLGACADNNGYYSEEHVYYDKPQRSHNLFPNGYSSSQTPAMNSSRTNTNAPAAVVPSGYSSSQTPPMPSSYLNPKSRGATASYSNNGTPPAPPAYSSSQTPPTDQPPPAAYSNGGSAPAANASRPSYINGKAPAKTDSGKNIEESEASQAQPSYSSSSS